MGRQKAKESSFLLSPYHSLLITSPAVVRVTRRRKSSWLGKDEIAELLILAKNEQNKTEQMQKMLLDECHLLF